MEEKIIYCLYEFNFSLSIIYKNKKYIIPSNSINKFICGISNNKPYYYIVLEDNDEEIKIPVSENIFENMKIIGDIYDLDRYIREK